jgi:hypothetical protein
LFGLLHEQAIQKGRGNGECLLRRNDVEENEDFIPSRAPQGMFWRAGH